MKHLKNRYLRSSKLSEAKFHEIVRLFSADLTAVQIAQLASVNHNTVNRILRLIRERILEYTKQPRPSFGTIEGDESWFGAKRVKGKRGRGAYGKTTVFGAASARGKSIPRSCRIAQRQRYKELFGEKLIRNR